MQDDNATKTQGTTRSERNEKTIEGTGNTICGEL